jgi:hypothetical protein
MFCACEGVRETRCETRDGPGLGGRDDPPRTSCRYRLILRINSSLVISPFAKATAADRIMA